VWRVGRKQAIGWTLIAAAAVISASIFTQAIIAGSEVPVSSSTDTPVVPLAPVEGE
jgi:hypothetical protein